MRAAPASMMIEVPVAAVSTLALVGTTIAAEAAENFGGYTAPVVGLGIIAATIALLAGPVED